MIAYIDKFTSVTNKVQAVAQTVKYSFFPSLDLSLPTHSRCRGLLSHLITLKDTHTHTESVGLPWTNDQPDTETSTGQETTLTRDRHPCPRRDSNPQSQQANGRRLTP